MRYIIIDDEPIAHRIIEGYCRKLPQMQKAGNCYDAFEGMQLLQKETADLLFLDINMPGLSGFEMLRSLQNSPRVIVTSAYKEFALEGYELDVCDYLLKPFSFERFLKAINKAALNKAENLSISAQSPDPFNKRIFIKGDKKQYQVSLDDILFIEAHGNYSKVFLHDEMILTLQKISDFEELLPTEIFIRVHKSFVVSLPKIKLIEGNRIQIADHSIPIGQTYRANVNRLYS
ncbi:response regulator [Leptobacterium flavescens]|uniref:Response regulator n=1 Tax=Leptobacterium flavescens TaxID=472055 RepID=A0A6P0UM29_9FLAO|nr:LytTR family DNA-binding domain-containing protein [Leptobacterium flavescens]NER13622.1 response regulator [Leptobacterium flavescens]